MATRDEKLVRAREIILAEPKAGRRTIANELRQEFGSGLRDATILSLQRQVYPQRGQVKETYLFAKESSRRFKPRREARYNALVKANFTAEEARQLSKMPLSRLPFVKDMKTTRKEAIARLYPQTKLLKLSATAFKKEARDYINFQYDDLGWSDKEGNRNPFSMLRQFRREAIDRGDWDPKDSPWRKRKRTRATVRSRWKGDTIGQHSRWRTLHKDEIRESKRKHREKQKAARK